MTSRSRPRKGRRLRSDVVLSVLPAFQKLTCTRTRMHNVLVHSWPVEEGEYAGSRDSLAAAVQVHAVGL